MISFGLRRTFPGRLGRLNPAQLIPLRDAPSLGRERSADGWSLTETGGRSARGIIGCGVRLIASAFDARASTVESCARPADLEELVLVLVALLPRSRPPRAESSSPKSRQAIACDERYSRSDALWEVTAVARYAASGRAPLWPQPPATSSGLATKDGAFMEPRGGNRWQSAANERRAETAKTSEIRCRRLPRVA